MTDQQIAIELARTIHGWKIAPTIWSEREGFFDSDSNFPCLDGIVWRADFGDLGEPWDPFDPEHGWNAAMVLAEAWAVTSSLNSSGIQYGFDAESQRNTWTADAYTGGEQDGVVVTDISGPRAVCMALAKAVGIEVEK